MESSKENNGQGGKKKDINESSRVLSFPFFSSLRSSSFEFLFLFLSRSVRVEGVEMKTREQETSLTSY